MNLIIGEEGEELEVRIQYGVERFGREEREAEEVMKELLRRYVRVVESMVEGSGKRVGEVEWMREEEKRQVLEEWSRGEERGEEEEELWVQGRVREQGEQRGDAIAVVEVEAEGGGEKVVSYGELERRSNQVAKWLKEMGVGEEDVVGLCVERSVEMVVGMLGVLKAGGAYLPLDGEYPEARLEYMLEDAGARVVMTEAGWDEPMIERIEGKGCRVVAMRSGEWTR